MGEGAGVGGKESDGSTPVGHSEVGGTAVGAGVGCRVMSGSEGLGQSDVGGEAGVGAAVGAEVAE